MEGRSIRGCAGVSLEVLDDVIVPDSQYPSGQYLVSASHEHLVGFGRFLLLSDGLKNVAEPCFRGLTGNVGRSLPSGRGSNSSR